MLSTSNLIKRGNTLQVTLRNNQSNSGDTSPEYVITGLATFQVKCFKFWHVRFVKLHKKDDLTYRIKVTNEELKIDKSFISNDGTWQELCDINYNEIDLIVVMDVVPGATFLAPLHEDEDLTDFELRGEDGSVHMHRAVLAASSPVLRRMLCGTWRESTDGLVDIPGTSMVTLQHFKDYVYLQTLPKTGLKQLLKLASYYMMPELEQKCIFKIVTSLTAENVFDSLDLIAKYKHERFLLTVLESVQCGSVDVKEMRNHFLSDD